MLVATLHRLRLIHFHLVEFIELTDSVDWAIWVKVDETPACDCLREGHVDEFWLKLQVQDLCGKVLASGIVKRN